MSRLYADLVAARAREPARAWFAERYAALRNTSERPRRTIILRMFDAACVIDRARLPAGAEAYFPVDAEGRLDTTAFPLVHG